MQRSLQVVIRQMFVLCSLKIESQWSEPMSFTFHSALRKLNTNITFNRCLPPKFGSFGQAVSEKKIVRNRPIRNKNCLWRPCLSTDRDEMCNLYRRPSIVASYQVSVHLAKQFEKRRFFLNRPIRNKNYLWRPCLLTDQDEMNNLYRGPSKFRIIWSSGFRGEDFQKSTNQKQELPIVTTRPFSLPCK